MPQMALFLNPEKGKNHWNLVDYERERWVAISSILYTEIKLGTHVDIYLKELILEIH